MASISVQLFNIPVVKKDKEPIAFPFKKAEALFYYLVVNRQATRDELVNLLWGEVDEETARKNLRHAMYKIRKTFDMDIIISPQKSIVMLNPDIEIDVDIEKFQNDDESIAVYTGEFLKGFYLKDSLDFEEWLLRKRQRLKELYVQKLYHKIDDCIQKNLYKPIENYGKLLIAVDPFDERAYRILMERYAREGAFNKAIDLYNTLSNTLEQELGIKPDSETKSLLDEIITLRDENATIKRYSSEEFFYGRYQEMKIIKKNYYNFLKGKDHQSLLILGEAGIGKTKLKDKFLEAVNVQQLYLLESNCYQEEEEYLLKPWNNIFSKLATILKEEKIKIPFLWEKVISNLFPLFAVDHIMMNLHSIERPDVIEYQAAEEAIIGVFREILKTKKILLTFEDLQWMDSKSLSLLLKILLHLQGEGIMFIGTCRNGYGKDVEKFIVSMIKYNLLEKIRINRFTQEEVEDFVLKALPGYPSTKEFLKRIYDETEGNTFFLIELLNTIREKGDMQQMSPKMQDILRSRFLDVSDEGRKLLNVISIFFDKVTLDILRKLSGKDEMEIMDIIEELLDKNILRTIEGKNETTYEFTHQKLKEFIYLQQSPDRRKILHNKVALVFEEMLKYDRHDQLIYSKLIYHFTRGGNKVKAIQYRIKNLDIYLDVNHELFPILEDNYKEGSFVYLSQKEAIEQLEEINGLLEEITDKEKYCKEVIDLKIAFLHMKGRYLIKEGEYHDGILCIQHMIEMAMAVNSYAYILKGYRQMINYSIQIHDIDLMREYLERGLILAQNHNDKKEIGILLRLKGLYKIMTNEYVEAEELLKQSINIFDNIRPREDKYILAIAAAFYYVGEIKRCNMDFASALRYFDEAITSCQKKKIILGLPKFNTSAGQAAFDMGDYDRAKNYFEIAIYFYNQLDTLWGRSIAEAYYALLLIKERNYKNALKCLQRAEQYAEKLKSPYELGLLYRVKAEIKINMATDHILNEVFKKHLPFTLNEYCNRGMNMLKGIQESYEIEIIRVLKNSEGY